MSILQVNTEQYPTHLRLRSPLPSKKQLHFIPEQIPTQLPTTSLNTRAGKKTGISTPILLVSYRTLCTSSLYQDVETIKMLSTKITYQIFRLMT